MSTRSLPPTLLAPLLLAALAGADTIHTTEGRSIDDCTVVEEGLLEVTYKREGSNSRLTMPSSDVLHIQFSSMPTLIDRAETAVADDQVFDAVNDFSVYLEGKLDILGKGNRVRPAWAPAYAAWRLAELNASMGKTAEALVAADLLVTKFSDSRYVPAALLLKAEIQFFDGKAGAAKKTLEAVTKLVAERGISERWELEAKLAAVAFDGALSGKDRRTALGRVASQAGNKFTSVRNRAQAIGAESFLEEKEFEKAQAIFDRVAKDSKSDQRTLAIAWSGLGDCFYQAGAKNPALPANQAILQDALKAYMRVVVLYKGESQYAARSMFYAGRIYAFIETEEASDNANKLFGAVVRQYPGTKWAKEARGFAKKR